MAGANLLPMILPFCDQIGGKPGAPGSVRFPECFPGVEPDGQIIGFWRPSFGSAILCPDYVLVANLVRDHNPAVPMLFEVACGMWPRKLAVGQKAVSLFKDLVAKGVLPEWQPSQG